MIYFAHVYKIHHNMLTLTIAIVAIFLVGYLCIALEGEIHVNKSATALIMCVVLWVLYLVGAENYVDAVAFQAFLAENIGATKAEYISHHVLLEHLGETCQTILFLMGAMTVVEAVDVNGGFDFVRDRLNTRSKRNLLWRMAFMTFFLSAILDNLTTSIVMIMVLRKVVSNREDRLIYASLIILAANSGGAFSPIGDVTTIMLWIKGSISTLGVIKELILPSLVSMLIPAFILQYRLKGDLVYEAAGKEEGHTHDFTPTERTAIFWFGVGGLIFVPIFKGITHLPPFMGILLVLGVLWFVTEVFYAKKHRRHGERRKEINKVLQRIDMATIFFFLGILMAVAVLQETGVLRQLGEAISSWNHYLVTGIIGVASSIVDNVPLVAACMGMYPIEAAGDFAQDGIFWQLLAYCAGVGGSILIIGSAAGVVVMGLEKITFGWYMKNISWIVLVGYLSGILAYFVQRSVLGM